MKQASLRTLLTSLQEEGKRFNWGDIPKSSMGDYARDASDFLIWAHRVHNLVASNFDAQSAPVNAAQRGLASAEEMEGNGQGRFSEAKFLLLAAAVQALDSLDIGRTGELQTDKSRTNLNVDPLQVFIVHGHDHVSKSEMELFIKELGLDPVVLHREADQGLTLIEKFERHSDVGYAVVLLTPDDVLSASDPPGAAVERRPRQNVILELGFFIGRLGRDRVCCLSKRGVTLPSDISGLVYKAFSHHIDEVKYDVLKELRAAGYAVSMT